MADEAENKRYVAVIVETMTEPRVEEIDGSLEGMQKLVGGLIEVVSPFPDDPDTVVVCNEEGKLMNLLPNRFLKDENGEPYDVICGDFFVLGSGEDGDFASLTKTQIDRCLKEYGSEMLFTAREKPQAKKDRADPVR